MFKKNKLILDTHQVLVSNKQDVSRIEVLVSASGMHTTVFQEKALNDMYNCLWEAYYYGIVIRVGQVVGKEYKICFFYQKECEDKLIHPFCVVSIFKKFEVFSKSQNYFYVSLIFNRWRVANLWKDLRLIRGWLICERI